MRKITVKKLLEITPLIVILVLSLLPVFYTWGRLPIWGDTIIPFSSAGLEKYLYQWISLQNGQYFSINYLPYFLFFKFIELFTHNIYIISAIMLFLLKAIAGLGIYKLAKLIYKQEREFLYALPITFYLLSPALLNASYYLYIYSFAPWFVYFIFKIVKRQKVIIPDLIWLSILLFFSSINLPNPKYIFHLFVISVTIFIVSLFLKLIDFRFFLKNFGKLIILLFLSVYLILPQLVFVSYYNSTKYDVHIKAGYKDVGQLMDFGDASLQHMLKLHKDSLNLNEEAKDKYNSSALINLLSYFFVILIIANIAIVKSANNDNKKYQYILSILLIIYLFFAAGSNPPFGFFYQYLVESFSLLAFLRTTAGATFFLSLLYALLLFSVVANQKKIKIQNFIFTFLMIAICIVGYPIINGETYKNVKVVSPNTDITKRGIVIPQDYFDIQKKIDSIKADVKILYTNPEISYIAADWGYFGVPIYDFMYNANNVDCINIKTPLLYNVGFILNDKSSLYPQNCPIATSGKDVVAQTNFIELSRIPKELSLPHFYIPQTIITTSQSAEVFSKTASQKDYNNRSAIYFNDQNVVSNILSGDKSSVLTPSIINRKTVNNTPIVEFKKINPTKYRVIIHGAKDNFPLIFLESFHDGWKAYLVKNYKDDKIASNDLVNYKIFDGNEDSQATTDELKSFIDKGYISAPGDLKGKNIDFVSKNFQGTIQNDNLPSGTFYETWFKKPVNDNLNHRLVNGYANSWDINPEDICFDKVNCFKNADGSYDMELVVEFWPQKAFYAGLFISGATFAGCLLYIGYDFYRRRKQKLIEKKDESIIEK